MALTKTIRKSRSFTRKVDGKIVESEDSTKRFQVPADEPRETDGGNIVYRYRKTTVTRNERGNKVRRTIRRKRVESKY